MEFVRNGTFSTGSPRECLAIWLQSLAILTIFIGISFHVGAKDTPFVALASAVSHERIMVFGDSLSAAYGISPAEGWVALLEEKLKLRGITVVNASISGETSGGGLSRIRTDLSRQKPTIVLVALGANDGLRGLPVAEMRRNLDGIIKAIRAANARAVLIGIQIPPNFGIEYSANFRDTYAALAKQYQLALVPFLLDGVAEKLELFQPDRLHPVAAAQPAILNNVMPAVEQTLNRKQTTNRKVKK